MVYESMTATSGYIPVRQVLTISNASRIDRHGLGIWCHSGIIHKCRQLALILELRNDWLDFDRRRRDAERGDGSEAAQCTGRVARCDRLRPRSGAESRIIEKSDPIGSGDMPRIY